MKNISKKLIILSFILAIIAAISLFVYLQSIKKPGEEVKNITVLVAVETIPARTLIDKKMIKEIQVPNNAIFNDYIKDSSKIIGKYSKDSIMKDEGFHDNNLLSKNENEISLNIASNHRAVSINVTGDSAVSDLLKSGDFVDIVSYLPEKKEGEKIVRPDTSKIILKNIEILAVDKQLTRDDTSSSASSASNTSNANNTKDKVPSTFLVTLSVPNDSIEMLILAEDIGSLKLALRPLTPEKDNDTNGAVWQDVLVDTDATSAITDAASSKDNTNKFVNYTVKKGETLRKISTDYYGDASKYKLIQDANNIQNENQIITGEVIKLPAK